MQQLILKNGNLYLSATLYEKYFNSIQAVALLKTEEKFLMLPIQNTGGGYLLKIKNASGDRVVHAWEFFHKYAFESAVELKLNVSWSTELAALTFKLPLDEV